MRQSDIVAQLKIYAAAEGMRHKRERITRSFLLAINPRIKKEHGAYAERAVRKVLEDVFATPTHPILQLKAMIQLCRDDKFEYFPVEDEDLVRRINTDTYFDPLSLDRLVVETQEGVV